MQTRFRLSILFFITAFVMLTSCSKKTNKEGRYVPETALAVILMNGESLSSKLSWEEMKQNGMFQGLDSSLKLDDYTKAALENPEITGIDTKKNTLIFVEKDSLGGYVACEGTIKDAAKFKEFNSKVHKDGTETEKNGIHFITSSNKTASWDKDKFVIVIDMPMMKTRKRFGDGNASSKRDVISTATKIYELSADKSLAQNEKFSELVSKPADLRFWMNVGGFAADNGGMAALSMVNIGKLYEDYTVTGIANFDNGKINIDMKTYAGKQLSDLYKKYSGSKINTDMIKRIPAKDLAALVAISFKPEAVKEFAKLAGMDGFINMAFANLGFTFDDCVKALKGDILFATSDIKKDSSGKADMNAIFSASIADKNSFSKLLEAFNNMKKQKMGAAADKLTFNHNDNLFAAGNDKATVDKFMNSTNNSSYPFLDKVSGASSVFYINFQAILPAFGKDVKDSLDNIVYQNAVKTLDNIMATGEGFKDGGSNTHIEINFMDKNTNSLKQLNSFVGVLGSVQKQKRLVRDKWMNNGMGMIDSTTVVAPAPQQ